MPAEVRTILDQFVEGPTIIFKEKLIKVILFGSYARGDYEEYSDIDIMILVDMRDEEIKKKRHEVLNVCCALDTEYYVFLSPIIIDNVHFINWLPYLPFYENVDNEGVIIYGK